MMNVVNEVRNERVYTAAKNNASSLKTVVAVLTTIAPNWKDEASVTALRDSYVAGHVAGSLGLDSREKAERIIALKPFTQDKSGDDRRNVAQHKAVRVGISLWSRIAGMAGMPNARTGKTRKSLSKAEKAAEKAKAAKDAAAKAKREAVPVASTLADVQAFALTVAANIREFQNKNAKAAFGDYRGIFESYVASVREIANPTSTSGDTSKATQMKQGEGRVAA
jgi:hypothetical protein